MIISISGPPGAGKTTLVRKLSAFGKTYIEDASSNPHLQYLEQLSGEDLAANQLWFSEKLRDFLCANIDSDVIILDQHPNAIVEVFGRLFYDSGRLSNRLFEALRESGEVVTSLIADKKHLEVGLRASVGTLAARIRNRDGVIRFAPLEFESLVTRFDEYSARNSLPCFDTETHSIEALRDLI